jgi:pimeloyl-ACP methyl ester carboxylesterase
MKKIYILHGWTYTLNAWDACLAELRARNFEPVMLNVPGLTTDSQKSWTLEDYVSWLDESLPQDEPSVVIGHSNGGRIALALAARKPTRISRLVLIASAGVVHNEFSIRIKRSFFGMIARVGGGLKNIPIIRKIFYRVIGAKDYGNAVPHMRETMKNLITFDLVPELPKIAIPTLILWGSKDVATPLSDGKLINQAISGSKLVVFDGVGHSPHRVEPRRVADEIAAWISA